MTQAATEILFQQSSHGGLSLKNRIVMSPMSRYRSPGGVPNDANVEYYRRRVAAGVGLIITEGTYIDHPGAGISHDVPVFFGAEALAGWTRVVDAVHSHEGAIIPQLWHVGAVRHLGMPPDPAAPGFGPSAVEKEGRKVVVAMTERDIDDVVASYARSARYARELGFDGVAIHGAHGYLIDQFLWTGANHRDDGYAGAFVDRCRFAVEIVRAVRAAVGPDFPVIFRFSQWKVVDYDARSVHTPEELAIFLGLLTEAGVDIFDVSARRFYQSAFEGDPRTLAAWTRQLSNRPVIAVGSIGLDQPHQSKFYRTADNVAAKVTDLRAVCESLERGDFDLAGVGRALLADPHWADKVRRGAFEEINPFTRSAMDNYA